LMCVIVVAIVLALKTKLFKPSIIREKVFKFAFYLGIILQLGLRSFFLFGGESSGTNAMSVFYQTFPRSFGVTVCTFLLLQWIKSSGKSFGPPLIIFILMNIFHYAALFILFEVNSDANGKAIWISLMVIYCSAWLSLAIGIIYYLKLTHPWNDITIEWIRHKKKIIRSWVIVASCLIIGSFLLVIVNYAIHTCEELYFGYTLYYFIGEVFPSLAMIYIQYYLPSNLFRATYQDLENMIRKYQTNATINEESKYICRICMENEIDTVMLECGHMFFCDECAKQLEPLQNSENISLDELSQKSLCPICRKPITRVVKIYR